MISKARIKDIKALHLPKFRQIYNKFIAEGDKVCNEFIRNSKYKIEAIYIASGSETKYLPLIKDKTVEVEIVSKAEMHQISVLKTPSDILMLLEKTDDSTNVLLKDSSSAIYLDGVQDPGNVGTIIRIADWFGIDAVIRSEETADFFHPKVVQSTMGSMTNVVLASCTLDQLIQYKKHIYGTFMEGMPLHQTELIKNGIMVMGSEGRGITPSNEQWINTKITITGVSEKVAESLNVAVATGIICAAWQR